MLTDMVSSRNQKERSKKPSIQKRGCVISPNNGSKVGLKAQKLLAQGIALGIMAISKTPCKGKSFVYCQVF